MHRYQPRIHLILRPDASSANAAVTDLESEKLRTFVFPESIFTAVTAYQNQLVSHLSSPIAHSSLFITSHLRAIQSLRFNFTPRFTRSLIFPAARLVQAPIHDSFLPLSSLFSLSAPLWTAQITKLKIDSNPFAKGKDCGLPLADFANQHVAKGFRDSSRLTDLERETVESLMTGVGYPRPPTLPPFFFNPNDPASLLLARERASLFGISTGPPVSHASAAAAVAAMAKTSSGTLWRPQINPNQMYNFLAASAACAPWYLAALAAESSGQRLSAGQMPLPSHPPPHSQPATSTASSYLWPSHSGSGLPHGLSFSDLMTMRQSMSSSSPHHFPLRPEALRDSSSPSPQMRYTPFSNHAKDGSEASASPLELTTTGTPLHSSLEK